MKLIIGLGNPGKAYANTRHNAGFMATEALADKLGATFSVNKKFNADLAVAKIGRGKILLLKPLTLMNLSGDAVIAAVKYFKIKKTDVLVIHDDKDIPVGEYRLQTDRGPAGHKGVESIIGRLNTQNFSRLRIGIKPNRPIKNTADFVLQPFTKAEEKLISKTIALATKELPQLASTI